MSSKQFEHSQEIPMSLIPSSGAAGCPLLVTGAELQESADFVTTGTDDPLMDFPNLRAACYLTCELIEGELLRQGVEPGVAEYAAARAYRLASFAALSVALAARNASCLGQ